MKNRNNILVVDDNSGIRAALGILLPRYFERVEFLSSPKTLLTTMRDFRPDAVLLDMNFEKDINTGNEGLFWLSEIKKAAPDTEVVLFTAYADIALAVEGMKRGAFDFIVKPYDNDHLVQVLSQAAAKVGKSHKATSAPETASMYWGHSARMRELHATVTKTAGTDANILITGENGTGKDVLAGEIHRLSDRSMKPLVSVDAGAITDTLFESELFGHVKGAFTGAVADHKGKIEQADGGTLFLDEIGNIPLHLQAKLLRVLQNRTVTKVGGTEAVPVDIRLICATNCDIEAMVRDGRFRDDLYYRINTIHLALPALRERTDEILPLAQFFIDRFAEKYHRQVNGLEDAAKALLEASAWDGNIRELQNSIEKAVILSEGELLRAEDFELSMGTAPLTQEKETFKDESLDAIEERAIRAAMERYEGNLTMVARSLEISRPTLYSKLKKYDI